MKYLFTVQGEGRGHMTQALAIKELIEKEGHEVVCVLIGTNRKKGVPDFFKNAFDCKVSTMSSPNFVFDKTGGVNNFKTVIDNIISFPKYLVSLKRIRTAIKKFKPDAVINFYEPMFGVYRLLGGYCKKSFAMGHQFMFLHPDYVCNKSSEHKIEMFGAKLFTRLIGFKSKKIALSITKEKDINGITIVPPILREDVFKGKTKTNKFVLIYTMSRAYGKDFLMESPHDIKFEVFTEKFWPSDSNTMKFGNITFNQLDGKKFLNYMKKCEMVVCSAGFETASEASYLGKKVMVIPTENHTEQYFNGWDFQLNGLAKLKQNFKNISTEDVKLDTTAIKRFKKWVDSYKTE